MKASKISWDDLKIIVAVGEHQTLSRAADSLSVNHSTLFRRLGAIEEALGVALFLRQRRQYVPTLAGCEMISLGHRIEADITNVLDSVAEENSSFTGDIRITTSDALLADYLNPLIASFIRKHPDIKFSVDVGNDSVNLSNGEADVAFRATRGAPEHLSGRKIGVATWAVYGLHSEWSNQKYSVDQLKMLRWVSFSHNLTKLQAYRWAEENVPGNNIVFRANSVTSVASAISNDIGIGLLPCMHGDKVEGLTRISPVFNNITEELWFLAHPDIRKSARIREFMNHCVYELSLSREKFIGEIY